jgi:hypothetical protein
LSPTGSARSHEISSAACRPPGSHGSGGSIR